MLTDMDLPAAFDGLGGVGRNGRGKSKNRNNNKGDGFHDGVSGREGREGRMDSHDG